MRALSVCILIIGGTGALGKLVAQWLSSSFPQTSIVLLGRSGHIDDIQNPITDTLIKSKSQVVIARGDVASTAEIAATVQLCQEMPGGLRAILHAGG